MIDEEVPVVDSSMTDNGFLVGQPMHQNDGSVNNGSKDKDIKLLTPIESPNPKLLLTDTYHDL